MFAIHIILQQGDEKIFFTSIYSSIKEELITT